MSITLEQLSARMRQGEQVPLRHTAQVALTLSIPSILQQIVVTAMEYIDAAMVGHIGAAATASIGIVSSSTWLLHGMLAGLCMAFSIQVAQYLGADRQQDARGVLRQSMLFNLAVGLAAAAFGVGISRFLPGWLGADAALRANASAYFAIWSASLPFIMAMGTYAAMLRSTGDALTPGLISIFTCVLDIIFNFFLINPTREMTVFGQNLTVWGLGWGVPGAALGTALANAVGGTLALGVLLLRDGPLCIRKPGSWHITRACLHNVWKVGAPLAAERAAARKDWEKQNAEYDSWQSNYRAEVAQQEAVKAQDKAARWEVLALTMAAALVLTLSIAAHQANEAARWRYEAQGMGQTEIVTPQNQNTAVQP